HPTTELRLRPVDVRGLPAIDLECCQNQLPADSQTWRGRKDRVADRRQPRQSRADQARVIQIVFAWLRRVAETLARGIITTDANPAGARLTFLARRVAELRVRNSKQLRKGLRRFRRKVLVRAQVRLDYLRH